MEEFKIEKIDLQLRLKKVDNGFVPDSTSNSVLDHLGLDLGNFLGGGEFSKVFRAQWKKEKKDVALKIIKKSKLPGEYLESNLPAQLFALQRTQAHPLVVDIFAIYESLKTYYLVFEYLPMGDLLDYVNKRGFLGEAESRKFFRQIIDVIDFCHKEGIVHGDVKLDNILLDQYFNIRLCDFEYCTILHSENATCTIDSGSVLYAAPEVYTQKSYDGIKADIWSMGICLYGMLCGRLPFNIPDPDVYIRIVQEKLTFTRLLSKNCRRLIGNIIVVNPSHRSQIPEIRRSPWLSQSINVDSPEECIHGTSSPALISPSDSQAKVPSPAETGLEHLKAEARARFVSGVLRAMATRKWAADGTQERVLRKDPLLTIGVPEDLNQDIIGYGFMTPTTSIHADKMVHVPDEKMLETRRKSDANTLDKELQKLKFSTAGKMARMAKVLCGNTKRDPSLTTLTRNVRFKAAVLKVQRELLGNWHVACRNMLNCAATFKKELEDKIEKQDEQQRMSNKD